MGLLDGYFDPDQFQASGGLLGRLLSLPQMQGLYQPDADRDQAPSAPLLPPLKPIPWPNLQSYGQPRSDLQTAAPDLHSQYQALRPLLGDRNAMLATVNPDIGRTLIAQALANQRPDIAGDVSSGNNAEEQGAGSFGAYGNKPVTPGIVGTPMMTLAQAGPRLGRNADAVADASGDPAADSYARHS
jgi:hypothetical protein